MKAYIDPISRGERTVNVIGIVIQKEIKNRCSTSLVIETIMLRFDSLYFSYYYYYMFAVDVVLMKKNNIYQDITTNL